MTSPPTPAIFGCDVGKDEIFIHDLGCRSTTMLANTPEALTDFADSLPENALVICEATGGYEALLLNAVINAGRQAHRAHPRKVKHFIRSLGTLAKTDAIDAEALARYGSERHVMLERWEMPDASLSRLQVLVRTRSDIVTQIGAWNNRLKAPGGSSCAETIALAIGGLKAALAHLQAEIASLMQHNEELARKARTLKTVTGFGPVVTISLLAVMPELGSLNRRTAASLAGLAPHPNQSGGRNGYRRTRGGRPEGKRVLFMAAMVASRCNPTLKAFYQRLIKNGKKSIVALTAVMRKLIVIANALLRDLAHQQVS